MYHFCRDRRCSMFFQNLFKSFDEQVIYGLSDELKAIYLNDFVKTAEVYEFIWGSYKRFCSFF